MSPFKPWKYYRHKNCIDLDIAIIGAVKESEEGTEATVMYWNRHYKYFQGKADKVLIVKAQYPNWSELPEDPS